MSNVNNPIPGSYNKILLATRDMTAASGDVAYTGVGFKPTKLTVYAVIQGLVGYSIGNGDSLLTNDCIQLEGGAFYQNNLLVRMVPTSGNSQDAVLVSYDADGFTLNWAKTLLPTGVCDIIFVCER